MSEVVKHQVGREVLGRRNAKTMTLYIEEWGGDVTLRQLSHAQVVAIQGLASEAVDMGKQQVRDRSKLSRFNFAMIRDSWIDENGEQILSDADYETIVNEPNSVIATLVTAISDFNAMGDQALSQAKKNSVATRNGDLSTNSH